MLSYKKAGGIVDVRRAGGVVEVEIQPDVTAVVEVTANASRAERCAPDPFIKILLLFVTRGLPPPNPRDYGEQKRRAAESTDDVPGAL